jgi:hypothetical protein
MKTLLSIIFIVFLSIDGYSQANDRFIVKGSAKLIATWTGENLNDASGVLSSGDKITITTRQVGIYITAFHKNVGKQLLATGGENELPNTIVKVYEYDFDGDGQQEIMIVHSPEFSIATVEVFNYSNGLSEKVGKFNGQFDIILEKNTIYLPYGSQGLGNEYIYKNRAFFELVYHNPNQE